MHANHGCTNKSPIKLNAKKNKLTRWFVDKWGKSLARQKSPQSYFKVTIPKNPLINNQVVTSIRNLITILAYPEILTYSWTLVPIHNWIWSCSSLFSLEAQISNLWLTLRMDSSTWLTPVTWTMLLAAKFFTSSIMKIKKHLVTKPYSVQTQ